MKSGIVTRRDPYMMDPSIFVDPNLILDYGSSVKGTNSDYVTAIFNQLPSINDLTGRSILDDVQYSHPFVDPFMGLIDYNDTQLENIILDSGLCGECVADNPWAENEFDYDAILKGLEQGLNNKTPQVEVKSEDDMSTCTIHEVDIANYEEVYACDATVSDESQSLISDAITEPDSEMTDNESLHSYATDSTNSTLKRRLSLDDQSEDYEPPKRKRTTTRRNKRVQDERVKTQNKVAAMKYRRKKRDEKSVLDVELDEEEEKNKKLKSQMEELKVNIDVLKELLGKYLSPNQLKVSEKQR